MKSPFSSTGKLSILLAILAPPAQASTHFSDAAGSCDLFGYAELYGTGLRYSFYFAWAGLYLALRFGVEDEVAFGRKGANIVALAVIFNLFISTANGSFALLEWYIVCGLLIIPLLCAVPCCSTDLKKAKGFGFTLSIASVLGLVQPMLYYNKLHQGYRSGCPVHIWFIIDINIYGKYWISCWRVASIALCIVGVASLSAAVFLLYHEIKDMFSKEADDDAEHATRDNDDVRGWIVWGLWSVLPLLVMISIEKTIKSNHMEFEGGALHNASQLIPFLAGFFMLLSSLWAIAEHKMDHLRHHHHGGPKDEEHEIHGCCDAPSSVSGQGQDVSDGTLRGTEITSHHLQHIMPASV